MTMQRDPENSEVDSLAIFANLDDAHILEIGSGDGRLTWRYAQRARHVTAIDPDPMRLAAALETRPVSLRNRVTCINAQAETLPFTAQTFDGVLLASSL
ncbi:MAG: class I SAM-dependent methyltransferase [Anaerolineae bacterium]|nr:class I SAM-dependent methyltransferase [Anaerolineae bacterium]